MKGKKVLLIITAIFLVVLLTLYPIYQQQFNRVSEQEYNFLYMVLSFFGWWFYWLELVIAAFIINRLRMPSTGVFYLALFISALAAIFHILRFYTFSENVLRFGFIFWLIAACQILFERKTDA